MGAKLDAQGQVVPDPATRTLLPLEVTYSGGFITFANDGGLRLEVMNAESNFTDLRIETRLAADGTTRSTPQLRGRALCGAIPFYGTFLRGLGLCHPSTDLLTVFGAALLAPQAAPATAPAGLGTVSFAHTATDITATLAGSTLPPDAHRLALLLIDEASGRPVSLDYAFALAVETSGDVVSAVSLDLTGYSGPSNVRVHLLVDTLPVAQTSVAF
jgi:hypothetical protein